VLVALAVFAWSAAAGAVSSRQPATPKSETCPAPFAADAELSNGDAEECRADARASGDAKERGVP